MKHLFDRGYTHGFGYVSPDRTQFLAAIPKNSSSFMKDALKQHGWTFGNALDSATQQQTQEVIVVLRDPVDRWISGFVQYIQTYILYPHGPNTPHLAHEVPTKFDYSMTVEQFKEQYNQLSERLIFDVINRFDDHVWPQTEVIEDLLPGIPRKYFVMGPDFDTKISQYLGLDLSNVTDRNSAKDNPVAQGLQDFFRERFELRPELRVRVANIYKDDYQLIEKAHNESR